MYLQSLSFSVFHNIFLPSPFIMLQCHLTIFGCPLRVRTLPMSYNIPSTTFLSRKSPICSKLRSGHHYLYCFVVAVVQPHAPPPLPPHCTSFRPFTPPLSSSSFASRLAVPIRAIAPRQKLQNLSHLYPSPSFVLRLFIVFFLPHPVKYNVQQ